MSAQVRLARSFGLDDPILPISGLPSATIDLVSGQLVCLEKVLRGTGLFYDDFVRGQRQVTPRQFLKLLANLQRVGVSEDLPLRLGRKIAQLAPSSVALSITQAPRVSDVFENFARFCRLHSPLLQVNVQVREQVYICFEPVLELAEHQMFLQLTALSALVTWLKEGVELSNQLQVQLPISEHALQVYDSHIRSYLKAKPSAGAPMLALVLSHEFYHQSQREISPLLYRQNRIQAKKLLLKTPARQGFNQVFVQLLEQHQLPDLPEVAELMNISPSTLKRKLKQQETSYQQLLDRTRKYLAVEELYLNGASNQRTAERLGFSDIANFRRSFKRWTGLLPSQLRNFIKS